MNEVDVNVPASNAVIRSGHGYNNHGLTEKDALNMAVLDVLNNINAVGVNVEKNGAANELATEKTAAAIQLANSLAFSNTQNLLISGFKDGRYDAAVNAAATALASAVLLLPNIPSQIYHLLTGVVYFYKKGLTYKKHLGINNNTLKKCH